MKVSEVSRSPPMGCVSRCPLARQCRQRGRHLPTCHPERSEGSPAGNALGNRCQCL